MMGGQNSIPEQQETNNETLGNGDLGRGGIINIEDIGWVDGEERLKFRDEQVQCVRKKGIGEENPVLAAFALMEEVILDQRQVKLKANQDANSITEVAVLGINEAAKIRELYRALCEIPDNAKEKN